MKKRTFTFAFAFVLAVCALPTRAANKDKRANFGDVVKLVERHYGVKHKGIPLLARAGIKVARKLTRYGEYGSFKLAVFEDQDFSAPRGGAGLYQSLRSAMEPEWSPLVQVRLDADTEQTYIFTKEEGKYFKVLVVTVERRDATVVQVDIAPQKFLMLMRDPDSMGKTINDEAREADDEQ